jgi:hypothetical protein
MSWRDRLQCASPMGSDRSDTTPTSVTSVTTSTDAQRVALVVEQPTLDVPISPKALRLREPNQQKGYDSIEALRAIADLLAAAYRRQQGIRQVPEGHAGGERRELALPGEPSVHGVVP